jgi:uncharacterized protein (TIGR03118 family)
MRVPALSKIRGETIMTSMHRRLTGRLARRVTVIGLAAALIGRPAHAITFDVTDILSNGAVPALNVNPDLLNPWGMAYGPGGPFRVDETLSARSEKFDASGVDNGLPYTNVVAIPPLNIGSPNTGPTGLAYNPTKGFLTPSGAPATFLFASLDGVVYSWNMLHGSTATPEIIDTNTSVFTGLTVGTNGELYVADVRNDMVRVYNASYQEIGSFTDPGIPSNYGPYNISQIGDHLIVTFTAKRNAAPGGYVDEFDLNGNLIKRLVTNGPLDNPWGIDVAPASFGRYAGDLLIGNVSNDPSHPDSINAFDPTTGAWEGSLDGPDGIPLVIDGLFSLVTGNGTNGSSTGDIYFTAGLSLQNPPLYGTGGLFGSITPAPEPASLGVLGIGSLALLLGRRVVTRRTRNGTN